MSPPSGGSASPDILDVILQQAQMIEFAIPETGPALAAATSILGAIYDAFGHSTPKETYSIEQAIDDLGTYIINTIKATTTDDKLTTIQGWQNKRAEIQADTRTWATTGDAATATAAETFFLNLPDYTKMWAYFGDVAAPDTGGATGTTTTGDAPAGDSAPTVTGDMVTNLEQYAMARTSYHSLAIAILMLLARSNGDTTDGWVKVGSPVRNRLDESLAAGVAHIDPIATFLHNAASDSVNQATAASASITDPVARNIAFTQKLRTLRHDLFLDLTTPKKMTFYAAVADAFRGTQANLKASPLPAKQPAHQSGGQPTGAGLGPRRPKTARFLFETSSTGTWVDVVANSTVSAGFLATQDAGSAKPTIYYRVDGAGVNGVFNTQLTAAGQLARVDAAIAAAYDAQFGAGEYAVDAAATPTRQDRLTSFLIPLTAAPPVGDHVVAMVYSAAPQLGATITDPSAYKQIYADALDAIAAWNAKHPTIENFRVTMLGTGINAGTPSPALNAQSAELIVDAVLAALSGKPLLQTLTILVNTNDAAGGAERTAFTAAAKAKGITATLDGFDVPWT